MWININDNLNCISIVFFGYEYVAERAIMESDMIWIKHVSYVQNLVDNWVACQATWQYLGPIFGSRDIMRQMPIEGELFQTVDQTWRDVMKKTSLNPGALGAAKDPERLTKLIEANRLLDVINKGLTQYLEVRNVLVCSQIL